MNQKLRDSHRPRLRRKRGAVALDRLIERESSPLSQLQYRGRREELEGRCGGEECMRA